jgi:hypothetical protein
MPYTTNDYYLELTRDNVNLLTPQERVRDLSPDDIMDLLFSDEILEHVSPEKKAQILQKLRQQQNSS